MPRFLIDVNLPRYFSTWSGDHFTHVIDIDDRLPDGDIWKLAKRDDLVIVSKDTDFSDRILLSRPPPRVVHIRLGNMKMREFHSIVSRNWPWIEANVHRYRLIRLFADHIEAIADEGDEIVAPD